MPVTAFAAQVRKTNAAGKKYAPFYIPLAREISLRKNLLGKQFDLAQNGGASSKC